MCEEEAYSKGGPLEPERDLYYGGNVELLGHFGGGIASDLILRGSDAFARLGRELLRLDLSDPRYPERSGYYYFANNFRLIHVASDAPEAVVALDSSLWSVDFSNPQEPSARNLYNTSARIEDVRINEGLAYLHVEICQNNDFSLVLCRDGLHVVDISGGEFVARPRRCSQDLLAAVERSWIFRKLPVSAKDRASMGKYEIIAAGGEGIRIYEVGASGSRREVGSYDPPSRFEEVLSTGQFAYVAEREGPLHVLDISDPADPLKVGEYADHRSFIDLELGEGPILRAIAEGGKSYVVLDISSPSSPRLVHSTMASSRYWDLEATAEKVYLLEDEVGIHIIDAEREEQSVLLKLDGPGLVLDIEVQSNLLYLMVDRKGEGDVLLVIDVISPANPELLSETPLEDPRALAVSGSTLFLLDNRQFKIFDVTNPAAPVLVRKRSERRARDLLAVGGTLYLQSDSSSLRVSDISDPYEPLTLATFAGRRSIEGFDESAPILLATQGEYGLLILRVDTMH